MSGSRSHVDDLRGASRLAVEATRAVTDLVDAMHQEIGGGPNFLGRPLAAPVKLMNDIVYGTIRTVTAAVGAGIDRALQPLAPLLGESAPGPERDALLAALNGVLGDYLAETGNPLAIAMRLRQGGRPLTLEREALGATLPEAGGKLLVLVHGSCMNDRQWNRRGHDHGAALARELGYTPMYLHYNSGLHISANGRALDGLLEELIAVWPVPLEELVLLGHSMGGLVSRSACLVGERAGHAWRARLGKLICLGSPHHGAPLERGGNLFGLLFGISRYSAPLGRLARIRSAGVTDMRHGNVLDEHWHGRDRFAHGPDPRSAVQLPAGVDCYAVAATRSQRLDGTLLGDGVVPVASALGMHPSAAMSLGFPEAHRWIGAGMGHLDLLDRPEVYQTLRSWLADGLTRSGGEPLLPA